MPTSTRSDALRLIRSAAHSALRTTVWVILALALGGMMTGAARAEDCSNEQLRAREVYALALADCRAYEQVTPVDKDGSNPAGGNDYVQASVSGDRITFLVLADMPGGGGSGNFPLFLASRDAGGWTSQGLLPLTSPGARNSADVLGWSEDISQAVVTGHLAGDNTRTLYLRDSTSGSYLRIVPVGGEPTHLAGFSADDSRVIFESDAQLLAGAAPGRTNLYELNRNNGILSLVGVLPASAGGGAPPGGSFAGPYDWQQNHTERGGTTMRYYTQGAISGDGSRVFFTAGETGQLYVRESGAVTVRVSASQRTVPDPNGPKPAAFMAATPDGSKVFFTSCEKLTDDSTAVSTAASSCGEQEQGQDLYEYDVVSGALRDLTVDSNAGDALGAAVQGVVGASADGSYVYFVANGMLPQSGASSPGSCQLTSHQGSCNLYLWHGGKLSFIGMLNAAVTLNSEGEGDVQDWTASPTPTEIERVEKSSRVTPDGKTLLFSSTQKLTGYDNQGFTELYRYDATRPIASDNPVCVSCDPTGAPPRNAARRTTSILQSPNLLLAPSNPASSLTRNLSADGSRVFFSTPDALVAQDTNNTFDAYEWEKDGAGSCRRSSASFNLGSGGCLYLISTGRSPDPSYFADASASGDNAFFFTDQPLVGQDHDSLIDVYDARVDGGIAEQNPPAPPAPCAGEACRGAPGSPPAFGAPSSATFLGAGNLTPPASTPVKPKTAAQIKAERLARALKACRSKKSTSKRRRGVCEAQARKRYGASKAKKAHRSAR